ncbi:hypothetical protein [Microcella flavibacter]|uniref:hypothetical protein n=1 Tax=Microcella flavibacter TaxID=1804990 RepID=UPI002B26FD31|nr:hypothetical protein [Microcella flavibacter]
MGVFTITRSRQGLNPKDEAPSEVPQRLKATWRDVGPRSARPALDAVIPTIELPAEAPGVELDPNNPLHPVFGRNWLKSRLRAHPNVVEAQHPRLLVKN